MSSRSHDAAALLRAQCISVSRGNHRVLCEVTFTLAPGELVCVLGPNGAGKSTLIGALAGTIDYSSGQVHLGDTELRELTAVEQARRRCVLPQEHTVGFSFTCREVVRMGRFPWNRTSRNTEDNRAVQAAMDECGVTEFANRSFATLSGGERARVALARVFAQETPIMLLDEPTAALDLRFQETVMNLVRARTAQGKAALIVVHDLSLAASFGDRVMLLANGRLVADGPPAQTLTSERISEIYGLAITIGDIGGQPVIVPTRTDHPRLT